MPDMSVERDGCAAVCIGGKVYVAGGWDGNSYLKSAEMYDTSEGQWRALPDMSVARDGCAAVCIEGNVYVVGGYDGGTKHASVECYDPIANEWFTLPSMSAARCYCAAAVGEMGRTRVRPSAHELYGARCMVYGVCRVEYGVSCVLQAGRCAVCACCSC